LKLPDICQTQHENRTTDIFVIWAYKQFSSALCDCVYDDDSIPNSTCSASPTAMKLEAL